MIDLIKINGPPSLQRKLRALCEEYIDIFDTTVRAEPADIPPMSIKIDETKWKSNKHRLPPRTHSVEKQSQIRQQCDKQLNWESLDIPRLVNRAKCDSVVRTGTTCTGLVRTCAVSIAGLPVAHPPGSNGIHSFGPLILRD